MALPQYSMRELIQAGVHFGHKTKRWNPRMAPFLFGVRNDVHIIDLQKTVPMLYKALASVRDAVAQNGRVLFVGTKHQASAPIAEAAKRCGQYYVNHRWLGGMLTNWNTIQQSIKTLRSLEEKLENPSPRLTKKELLTMSRQRDKLELSLGGIKDMGGLPNLIFVLDTNREDLAIAEANKLGIPVVAVVDSNSTLEGVDFPIPGNDDATRAIELYCRLVSDAALAGIQTSMAKSGKDLGAAADLPEQNVPGLEVVADNDDASKAAAKPAAKKAAAKPAAKKEEAKEEKAPAKKAPAAKKPAAKTTTKKAAAKK
jgi:small subunit ribosomal protein S2